MSGKGKSKARIQASKPELPPFLQRMKEQVVINEDNERRERAERQRKLRPIRPDDPDDGPTIVKIGDDDITEEEYKRIKKSLDTQYKLEQDKPSKKVELDIDKLIQDRKTEVKNNIRELPSQDKKSSVGHASKRTCKKSKVLSYSSSSDDSD